MTNEKWLVAALVLVLGTIGALGVSAANTDEEEVTLDQLPDSVRSTIEQHVDGHPIEKIEREREGGRLVYEVEQIVGGREVAFQVSESGEYLGAEAEEDGKDDGANEDESEEVVVWAQLPPAVQEGLAAALGGVTAEEVTRETERGHTVYEAEYEANGSEFTVVVSEQGDLLESEQEIDASTLPPAIVEQLTRIAPDAELEEVELVTVTYYEIELQSRGRERELRMLSNGQRLDDDD